MSTRGVVGFQINNIIKATYNHSDSYPEGLGCEVVDFLVSLKLEELEKLKQRVCQLRWLKEEDKPTRADKKHYSKFADLRVGAGTLNDWYCLLRNAQGANSLAPILTGELVVLIDSTDFLKDSLFCEWGYIINFDNNTLDTYEGFQKQPDKTNPLGSKSCRATNATYYPCKRIFQLALGELVSSDVWFKRFKLATRYKG